MTNELIKDKDQTMQKLLLAFDKILTEEGFQSLGINKIAKTAEVSKVLIYRYFGDFDGLLTAYLEQKAFWLTEGRTDIEAIRQLHSTQIQQFAVQLFCTMFDNLISSVAQQEIHRWELLEYNSAIETVCQKIEEPSKLRNQIISETLGIKEEEVAGVIAVLIGGIYYLTLRAKTVDEFNGVNLRSTEGHATIKNAIKMIINTIIK